MGMTDTYTIVPTMDTNQISESDKKRLEFPRTLNNELWERYLWRDLSQQEVDILESFRGERHMNKMISALH